jgi:hypothetical protein
MGILSYLFGGREKNTPKLASASEIAAHIQRLIPYVHSGTLRFWGVWFGRPHDNNHTIVGAEADGDCLTLRFDDEEILRVWQPADCQIDPQHFIIYSASRVLWQWYWYGRPHTSGNLMSNDFVRDRLSIRFESTFPGQPREKPTVVQPAVQIH